MNRKSGTSGISSANTTAQTDTTASADTTAKTDTTASAAFKVLRREKNQFLIIKVGGHNLPRWVDELPEGSPFQGEEKDTDDVTATKRFTMIAPILDTIGDSKATAKRISQTVAVYGVSRNTICNYLNAYLVYGKAGLSNAPKKSRELTEDEKNMRWALNKYYYNRHKQSITYTYKQMLKQRYTDNNGQLLSDYPTQRQFRYFFQKYNKKSNELISRNGLSDYKRNNRPCTSDYAGYFNHIGIGMLDATVCDIYLINDAKELVGRPQLCACIDAYSGLCMGYSLDWEGGAYALRNLMMNVVSDKVEYCSRFGISITQDDWDCKQTLPAQFITDMGREYKGANFEQITELGCRITNLDPYRPDNKSKVEKFFDVIQGYFKPILKGRGVIESDYQERGVVDYRRQACLTLDEFEKCILHCILYYNRSRLIKGFPMTEEMLTEKLVPTSRNIWEYGRKKKSATLISVEETKIKQVMLPRTEGVFRRNGLIVNGLRYRNQDYAEEYLSGRKVTVSFDPDDCNQVYIVEDGYSTFRLIEERYKDKTVMQCNGMQEQTKEILKENEQEEVQAYIEMIDALEVIANKPKEKLPASAVRTVRAVKAKERRKCHA